MISSMAIGKTSFLQSLDPCAKEIVEDVAVRRQRDSKRASYYMIRMLQNHYTLIDPIVKTQRELARESWLFPTASVPFNRWFCLPAAFIIQFCCGSLFTWIVFDKPIDKFVYGPTVNMAPITFYIAVSLFGLSAAIIGPTLERKGPKMASILGGTLFFIGNIMVALALHMKQMWLVYLGYSISGGLGIGMCLLSPVSVLKWFPDFPGLASGIAVTGFAAGSLANAKLQTLLIQAMDLPLTFAVQGMAYFLCIVTAGLILRNPPPGYLPPSSQHSIMKRLPTISEDLESAATMPAHNQKEWTLLEALGSTDFRLMYLMFFANLLFNLGLISEWPTLITGLFSRSKEEVSNMIFAKGCFNLLGRVCFPLLSEYIGRKNTYFLMLTTQLFVLISFYFITTSGSYYLFVVNMCIVAACCGGGFGTLSIFLMEKFGAVNLGPCYGVIITAWSLAGIFGRVSYQLIGQAVIQNTGAPSGVANLLSCNITIWVYLGAVIVGWVALLFVKPTSTDMKVYKTLRKFFKARENTKMTMLFV